MLGLINGNFRILKWSYVNVSYFWPYELWGYSGNLGLKNRPHASVRSCQPPTAAKGGHVQGPEKKETYIVGSFTHCFLRNCRVARLASMLATTCRAAGEVPWLPCATPDMLPSKITPPSALAMPTLSSCTRWCPPNVINWCMTPMN